MEKTFKLDIWKLEGSCYAVHYNLKAGNYKILGYYKTIKEIIGKFQKILNKDKSYSKIIFDYYTTDLEYTNAGTTLKTILKKQIELIKE